jgi:hypothetical protein
MTTAITKPLTLSGRYFSKKELAYVQQTVETFSRLSLTELAETICEHLHWVTAKKRNKINACLSTLTKLDTLGYLSLPVTAHKSGASPRRSYGHHSPLLAHTLNANSASWEP